MKISCIIPVVQVDLAKSLISDIDNGTKKIDELIIIDNSNTDIFEKYLNTKKSEYKLKYVKNNPSKYVNESWTQAFGLLDPSTELVSVLNDDLILNKYFFEILDKTMYALPDDLVVACPYTVKDRNSIGMSHPGSAAFSWEVMLKREGWAFTMRKSFLDKLPPIPLELKTFCGDDWIWLYSIKTKQKWVKMMRNCIYHYCGSTVKNSPLRATLNAEKLMFERMTKTSLKTLGNRRIIK